VKALLHKGSLRAALPLQSRASALFASFSNTSNSTFTVTDIHNLKLGYGELGALMALAEVRKDGHPGWIPPRYAALSTANPPGSSFPRAWTKDQVRDPGSI
jgi:hypothetical protein